MAAALWKAGTVNAFSTTINGSITNSDATITLTTTTGLQFPGVLVIDRQDANGNNTPTTREYISFTGISGADLTGVTRGLGGSSAQAHSSGAIIEEVMSITHWNDLISMLSAEHNANGTHSNVTATSFTTGNLLLTGALDMNGQEITLDADADTSITADTDDQIDFETSGADAFRMKATDFDIVNATGNVTVNGADPWKTISLSPGFLKPTTTAGCGSLSTVEAGTNDIDYDVLPFDASTDENAFANFQMPDSWDGGVIQFRYIWTNASGLTTETVEFELSGRAYADSDAIDQAVGTAVAVSDTWLAQNDIHVSAWSGDVTLAGSPAGGQWVHLELMRDVSDDTLTGDARLIALQIRYKQAQFSD